MMRVRLTGVAFTCALALAAMVVGSAAADPSKGSDPLTYSLTNCTDGSSFTAFKQRSQGAALFLADGSGIFIAVAAVSDRNQYAQDGTFIPVGTVFFETPGFAGPNGLPTITCTNFSPLSETWSRLTGYIVPST
jgi:hypothetical protein